MYKFILQHLAAAANLNRVVLLGCKAHKAFFVDKNFERVTAEHEHIHTHVGFEALEQERIWNILLNHAWIPQGNGVDVVRKKYAFALAQVVWLENHSEAGLRRSARLRKFGLSLLRAAQQLRV